MCYEYDDIFERARLAEQLQREKQREKKRADELNRKTPAPAAEPEKGVKERQPVPA
jgi:hypothetical protein